MHDLPSSLHASYGPYSSLSSSKWAWTPGLKGEEEPPGWSDGGGGSSGSRNQVRRIIRRSLMSLLHPNSESLQWTTPPPSAPSSSFHQSPSSVTSPSFVNHLATSSLRYVNQTITSSLISPSLSFSSSPSSSPYSSSLSPSSSSPISILSNPSTSDASMSSNPSSSPSSSPYPSLSSLTSSSSSSSPTTWPSIPSSWSTLDPGSSSFEDESSLYYNGSSLDVNGTLSGNLSWWQDIPYPGSGYTQLSIILLALLITIIMILIVVGNLLVCIAISTEKSLKTVQNWFIASLAVSDLCLGLVIMPFSLAYELMGYWIFGDIWCEVHHALDVLLCTASINNLCLISLDRYWSVTQAVEYLKKRTPARAIFMIGFVWCFSALVSLPPLLGWKGRDEEGQCTLSEDQGYVLYSAFGSFFIPAVVMIFVYARIFVAARSRARRNIKKKKAPTASEVTTNQMSAKDKSSPPSVNQSFKNSGKKGSTSSAKESSPFRPGVCVISATSTSRLPSILTPTLPGRHPSSSSDSPAPMSPAALMAPEIVVETSATPFSSPAHSGHPDMRRLPPSGSTGDVGVGEYRVVSFASPSSRDRIESTETKFGCEDIEESDPNISPMSKSCPPVTKGFLTPTPLSRCKSSPYGSTMSIADFEDSDMCTDQDSDQTKPKVSGPGKSPAIISSSLGGPPSAARVAQSEAERHKRKVAKARERRATFILGLIMASFVGAWLPFFTMYLIQGLCKDCVIDPRLFTFAFWLGYCNSAINPIIYTVFNRDFRKAFRKILFR